MAEQNVAIRLAAVGGQQVKAEFAEIGREGQRAFAGLARADGASGFALQNVGFQVQDFAVQVAGGTSASRALAQQLPQLLSGFGLLGVGLGTAAAIFLPFIGRLFDSVDAAKALEQQLAALEKSTAAYQAAARNAAIPMDDLTAKFGGQAEAVRELYDVELALAQLDLAGKQRAVAASIAGQFDGLDQVLTRIAELQALPFASAPSVQQELENLMERLRGEFGLTVEQATVLKAQLDGLGTAAGPAEAADAMAAVRQSIIDAAGGYGNLTEAQIETIRLLTQAQEAAVLFGATDMSGGLRGANAEAQTLVERINLAIERGAQAQAYLKNAKLIGAYQLYADTRTAAPDAPAAPVAPPTVRAGGGGGGGGISEAQREQNELMREAERIFEQTRTAAENYEAGLGKLNEMLKAGYIDQDTYNRALADLEEKTKNAGKAANEMRDNFEKAFVNIITGAESANEAIANLLAQMAGSLAQQGVSALFDALGGGDLFAGLFGSAKGNVFDGGNVIPFANGGVVGGPTVFPMKGGLGLMGEAGPEAIVPLSRGRDGKLGIRAEGAGGSVSVTINISVDARGAVNGVAEEVAAAVRAQTPGIVRQTVAAVGDARRRGRQV